MYVQVHIWVEGKMLTIREANEEYMIFEIFQDKKLKEISKKRIHTMAVLDLINQSNLN